MNKKIYLSIVSAIAAVIMQTVIAQTNTFPATGSAGIGTTTPNASSVMEMVSTTKGLLIPRMIKTQRDAIVSPVAGLMIYQTNSTPGFYYYNGTVWIAVSAKGANPTLSNLSSTTAINADLLPNATNMLNLGSSAFGWKDIYLGGSIYSNGNRFIGNDGTNTWVGLHTGASYTGNYNNALGYSALYSNTSGSSNTAIGYNTLYTNSAGSNNVAIGQAGMYSNTTGSNNIAVGFGALYANETGSYNNAYGYQALFHNTTGYSNVAIGNGALFTNTAARNLVAIGDSALYNQSVWYANIDYYNTAIGSKALFSNTIGSDNTANGSQSLYSNTSGGGNTANGSHALYFNTGSYNTANGYQSLYFNTGGYSNIANGYRALYSNTIGKYNVANGGQSLYSNIDGYYNTATGDQSLYSSTTADHNTANGYKSLYFTTTGFRNTANGDQSLYSNTTGFENTADGYGALSSNSTGAINTAIGAFADVLSGNLSNTTAIGFGATVSASNKVRIGNTDVTSIGGQVSWSTFSDGRYKKNIKEDVKGLSFINSLRPITYTVDINGLNAYYDKGRKHDSAYEKMKAAIQPSADEAAKIVYNGFIAQDVETAAKKLNYDFSGVDKPQTSDGLYGLRYSDFVVPLVKAVQELSKANDDKDGKINDLQKQNSSQQKINADLQKQIDELKAMMISGNQINAGQTSNFKLQTSNNISLEQNTPNPFNSTTVIYYTLPQTYSSAQIVITDRNGKTLKQASLSGNGKGSLNVDASTLASGAYHYSLYVDGKMIGSKQMILAK